MTTKKIAPDADSRTGETERVDDGQVMAVPHIICGAHGGGTSYVTKMLRFAGFFAGHDAGSIDARKFHESKSFKAVNYRLADCAGDRDLLSLHALQTLDTELCRNLDHWRRSALEALAAAESRFEPPRSPLWFRPIWPVVRLLNRLLPYSRWTWPGYVACRLGTTDPRQPWGWKDPRNSVTLRLWLALFPHARVIVIHKKPSDAPSHSPSGAWFRDDRNRALVARYQNPELDNDAQVMHVSFESLTHDVRSFNALLVWLGMPGISARQFEGLLKVTRFEGAESGAAARQQRALRPGNFRPAWRELR